MSDTHDDILCCEVCKLHIYVPVSRQINKKLQKFITVFKTSNIFSK